MSEKNFHPPQGQNTVPEEQNNIEPMPQVHNVPTAPQQNIQPVQQPMPQQYIQPGQQPMPQQYIQPGQQPMPQQYIQPGQQPMPQQYIQPGQQPMPQQYIQPGQQPMPQQQYVVGSQAMPQQQYVQQMPRQYYQQQQQIPGQVMPQYYQQMPGQQYPVGAMPIQPWTTELFDCGHDLENSLITAFFPCITFGQIADITDRGMSTCMGAGLIYGMLLYFTGFHWIYSWMYRTRMRLLYNLPEDPFPDCLVHFLCEPCALCQEYRELKNRGFNMQLGWIGNMQLQAQKEAAVDVPPPVQGMTR